MPSTILLETIGEQFTGILEIIRDVDSDENIPGTQLRKEGHRHSDQVFDLLSHGESLPFFRQNYMELSGHISRLGGDVTCILGLRKMITVADSELLSGLLERIKETTGIFYSTWMKLEGKIFESGREIKLATAPLFKAEEIARSLNKLAFSPGASTHYICLAECANNIIISLQAIELALKKLIVVRTV